jgi:cystinosin
VWLNYKRQSTDGWNVYNVMLDFGGGALSLVQLVLDGAATHDWSAVTGRVWRLLVAIVAAASRVVAGPPVGPQQWLPAQ